MAKKNHDVSGPSTRRNSHYPISGAALRAAQGCLKHTAFTFQLIYVWYTLSEYQTIRWPQALTNGGTARIESLANDGAYEFTCPPSAASAAASTDELLRVYGHRCR